MTSRFTALSLSSSAGSVGAPDAEREQLQPVCEQLRPSWDTAKARGGHWWRNQESPEGPLWAEARDEDTFQLLHPVLSWNHIRGKSALSRTHGFQSGSIWDSRGYVSDIMTTAPDIYEALTSAGSICGPHRLSFWGQTDLYHHFTERKTGAQRWSNFPKVTEWCSQDSNVVFSSKYLLSSYYMPGTAVQVGNAPVNKTKSVQVELPL